METDLKIYLDVIILSLMNKHRIYRYVYFKLPFVWHLCVPKTIWTNKGANTLETIFNFSIACFYVACYSGKANTSTFFQRFSWSTDCLLITYLFDFVIVVLLQHWYQQQLQMYTSAKKEQYNIYLFLQTDGRNTLTMQYFWLNTSTCTRRPFCGPASTYSRFLWELIW